MSQRSGRLSLSIQNAAFEIIWDSVPETSLSSVPQDQQHTSFGQTPSTRLQDTNAYASYGTNYTYQNDVPSNGGDYTVNTDNQSLLTRRSIDSPSFYHYQAAGNSHNLSPDAAPYVDSPLTSSAARRRLSFNYSPYGAPPVGFLEGDPTSWPYTYSPESLENGPETRASIPSSSLSPPNYRSSALQSASANTTASQYGPIYYTASRPLVTTTPNKYDTTADPLNASNAPILDSSHRRCSDGCYRTPRPTFDTIPYPETPPPPPASSPEDSLMSPTTVSQFDNSVQLAAPPNSVAPSQLQASPSDPPNHVNPARVTAESERFREPEQLRNQFDAPQPPGTALRSLEPSTQYPGMSSSGARSGVGVADPNLNPLGWSQQGFSVITDINRRTDSLGENELGGQFLPSSPEEERNRIILHPPTSTPVSSNPLAPISYDSRTQSEPGAFRTEIRQPRSVESPTPTPFSNNVYRTGEHPPPHVTNRQNSLGSTDTMRNCRSQLSPPTSGNRPTNPCDAILERARALAAVNRSQPSSSARSATMGTREISWRYQTEVPPPRQQVTTLPGSTFGTTSTSWGYETQVPPLNHIRNAAGGIVGSTAQSSTMGTTGTPWSYQAQIPPLQQATSVPSSTIETTATAWGYETRVPPAHQTSTTPDGTMGSSGTSWKDQTQRSAAVGSTMGTSSTSWRYNPQIQPPQQVTVTGGSAMAKEPSSWRYQPQCPPQRTTESSPLSFRPPGGIASLPPMRPQFNIQQRPRSRTLPNETQAHYLSSLRSGQTTEDSNGATSMASSLMYQSIPKPVRPPNTFLSNISQGPVRPQASFPATNMSAWSAAQPGATGMTASTTPLSATYTTTNTSSGGTGWSTTPFTTPGTSGNEPPSVTRTPHPTPVSCTRQPATVTDGSQQQQSIQSDTLNSCASHLPQSTLYSTGLTLNTTTAQQSSLATHTTGLNTTSPTSCSNGTTSALTNSSGCGSTGGATSSGNCSNGTTSSSPGRSNTAQSSYQSVQPPPRPNTTPQVIENDGISACGQSRFSSPNDATVAHDTSRSGNYSADQSSLASAVSRQSPRTQDPCNCPINSPDRARYAAHFQRCEIGRYFEGIRQALLNAGVPPEIFQNIEPPTGMGGDDGVSCVSCPSPSQRGVYMQHLKSCMYTAYGRQITEYLRRITQELFKLDQACYGNAMQALRDCKNDLFPPSPSSQSNSPNSHCSGTPGGAGNILI